MALMDDIRRRVREKHLKEKELKRQQEEQKKELERQRQEERKKEQERGQIKNQKDLERRQQEKCKNEQAVQQPSKPASSGKDEYVRVKGRYGWTWTKRREIDADTRQQGVINERPCSQRALDGALRSSLKKEEARDTLEGPVSFVSKAGAAASPISDVTYSPSPAKKSVAIMEPGDPIAAARRRLMEKEALKEVVEKGEDPADVARRALMHKEHEEATRNIEDPIGLARRLLLEKERKEAARKEADTSSLAGLPQSPRQPVNGIESVHDDLVQASRRLARDREEVRARQVKKEARAEKVRNPVALMERTNEARRSFSSPVVTGSDATPSKVVDSTLWDDSESEEPKEEGGKKKKSATGKRGIESRKELNDEGGGDDKNKKPAREKSGDGRTRAKQNSSLGSESGGYSDESDDESDEEAENTLIPTFENPQFGPFPFEPLKLPCGDNAGYVHEVPASINRYLKPYQQKGITFLYSCIMVHNTGAILGDDMGLGKTVQIIALLASLLQKTGTGKDAIELNRRRRLIAAKRREVNAARDEALLFNGVNVAPTDNVEVEGLALPKHAPILVIAPPSVVANWMKEFKAWGCFGVGSYHDERQQALDRVKDGTNEVLVCGASLFLGDFDDIASVKWKLIVVDEFHGFKNRKTKGYLRLEELRKACACQIVGMTGTLMQNNHEELWNLVDLVQPGHFGDWDSFKGHISLPILFGRTKTAEADTVQRSIARSHQLKDKLDEIFIKRTKEEVLGDELPEKEESIIFCELTEIQKRLYEYVLTLPDFELLKYAHAPCDCGVNRSIFMGYKRLRNNKERVAYLRRHRDDVTKRKDCCYKTPLNPFRDEEGQPFIHPLAPIWISQHEACEECKQCPFCIMFPALNKLYKLASHACLIQAEHDPNVLDVGTTPWKAAINDVEFAKAAIPPEILSQLPGGSYVMQDGIMNDHATLSGKMQKLEKLLEIFSAGNNRVLLFSHWTKTLDVIQQFVQAQGYSFIRLDGSTSQQKRQPLVDRFQKDNSIFLFLISTKAGGLGLNLTAANKVICFDMDYNPSHDEQAQDRAYRIGQSENVQVIRLVSQGTIEELKYVRQIYKVQLRQETLGNHKDGGEAARMFRGVQGDKSRKGELYGIENLLKFKDGSFMDDLWKVSENRLSKHHIGVKMTRNNDLKSSLAKVSEAEMDEMGDCFQEAFDKAAASERGNQDISGILGGQKAIHHQDFLLSDRGEATLKPGDEGFEEEMGGASQMVLNIFDRGGVDDDDDDMESVPKQPPALEPANRGDLAMILKDQNNLNHKDSFHADQGNSARKLGNDGFKNETGGCSQMGLYIRGCGGIDDEHESGSKLTSPEETTFPPRQPCDAGASLFTLETTEESPQAVTHAIARITKTIATSNLPERSVKSLPKMTKKRAASPNCDKSKTTFSARDICMPSYNKKKRSMK